MKKKYLRYIIIFCGIVFIITIILVLLDLLDITKYIHLSKEYDWLAYIGTVLAGIGTMLGIYLTFSQSQEIEKNNVKPWIKVSKVDSDIFDLAYFFIHKECNKKSIGRSIVIKLENAGNRELTNLRLNETKEDGFYQSAAFDGFVSPGLNSKENIMIELNYYYTRNDSCTEFVENNLVLFFEDCYGNSYYQTFEIKYYLELDIEKPAIFFNNVKVKASSPVLPLDDKIKNKLNLAEELPKNFDYWSDNRKKDLC